MFKKEDIRPGADLRGANLIRADLFKANLVRADLIRADLREADLREADLSGANLIRADLIGADLSEADLREANLIRADLIRADLTDTKGLPIMECPESGSYVGYKKARIYEIYCYITVIITLEIPAGAKRSSATTNKCRCSEDKVLSIESVDGSKKYKNAVSFYDNDFVYEVGKTVRVDVFNDDRWNECAPGIHHFMTRKEAEEYCI